MATCSIRVIGLFLNVRVEFGGVLLLASFFLELPSLMVERIKRKRLGERVLDVCPIARGVSLVSKADCPHGA